MAAMKKRTRSFPELARLQRPRYERSGDDSSSSSPLAPDSNDGCVPQHASLVGGPPNSELAAETLSNPSVSPLPSSSVDIGQGAEEGVPQHESKGERVPKLIGKSNETDDEASYASEPYNQQTQSSSGPIASSHSAPANLGVESDDSSDCGIYRASPKSATIPSPGAFSGSVTYTVTSPNPSAPVFIAMGNADNTLFGPLLEESSRRASESWADNMARNQIRGAELVLGRSFTEEDKEVIRSYYREMAQPPAPEAAGVPTTIHSPLAKTESVPEPSRALDSNSTCDPDRQPSSSPGFGSSIPQTANDEIVEYHDNTVTTLRNKVDYLEARLQEATEQRIRDQRQLDSACVDIARFQKEKNFIEGKLVTLEKKLDAVMTELNETKAHIARREEVPAQRNDTDMQPRESTASPLHPRPLQTSWFSLAVVPLAMAALVFLTAEAMWHSKRLSDGLGPFINGGYNGLGSVVIFGTWRKFLLFNAIMLHLGTFAALGFAGLVDQVRTRPP